jgi:methionyl-tRNA formyltransferase
MVALTSIHQVFLRFRGAAPLQRTIIAGDTSTEICVIQMDEGLDTGDILNKKLLPLHHSNHA